MARKKIAKAHWTPDESLRPLTGHESEDDEHLRRERVVRVLDDAGLRQVQHEIVTTREQLKTLRTQLDALKFEMKEPATREKLLLEAMVSGTLEEWREVYAYANDAEQTVEQYDPATKQLLATRLLAHYERQMEFDYGPDRVEFDPEDSRCPEDRCWGSVERDEAQDEDGREAYVCGDCKGRLMFDAGSGTGMFYPGPQEDDADDTDEQGDEDADGVDE